MSDRFTDRMTDRMKAQAQPEPFAGPVPSPCVSVCRMDAANTVCQGCWRTLAEIAAWSTMDDAAKRAVWLLLPARRPG